MLVSRSVEPQVMASSSSNASHADAEFRRIYVEYSGFVRSTLRRLYVDPSDLEDVTQEVFVVLFRHLVRSAAPTTLRAWLYQVARRVASNYRRGRRRAERKKGVDWCQAVGLDLDDRIAEKEAFTFVREFMDELDPPSCAVFVLSEVEGLSGRGVAARLGISHKAAYTRIRRVRGSFDRAVARRRREQRHAWALLPLLRGITDALERGGGVGALALRKALVGVAVIAVLLIAAITTDLGRGSRGPGGPEPGELTVPPPSSHEPRAVGSWPRSTSTLGDGTRGVFAGTVVDEADRPLAGALVCVGRPEASAHGLDRPPPCVRSGPDGKFFLPGEHDQIHVISAMLHGYRTAWHETRPGSNLRVVMLLGGVMLRGRVRDLTGGGVPGAWVVLWDLDRRALGPKVETDAEGEFAMTVDRGHVRLLAGGEGYAPLGMVTVAPGANIELMLSPESSISGTVERDGLPVEGAIVRAQVLEGGPDIRPATTRSGEGGRFELRGLQPEDWYVTAHTDDGFGRVPTMVSLGLAQSEEVTIVLKPAASIRGKIVNEETGEPCLDGLASARVGLRRLVEATQAEGLVEFDGLPRHGLQQISVSCSGHAEGSFEVDPADETVHRWALRPGRAVRGRVVLDDGEGLAGWSVWLQPAEGHHATYLSARRPILTDPSGAFDFPGVGPGRFDVLATGPGHPPALPISIDVGEQESVEGVHVRVERGATVSGRVHDAEGQAVAGAVVSLRRPWPELAKGGHRDRAQMLAILASAPHEALTAEDGSYEIRGVRAGRIEARVRTGGDAVQILAPRRPRPPRGPALTALAVEAGEHADLDLEIVPLGGTISGVVTGADGDRLSDVRVTVQPMSAGSGVPFWTGKTLALTDDEGHFEITGLRDEQPYLVQAFVDRGPRVAVEDVWPGKPVKIEIGAQARVELDAKLSDGTPPEQFIVAIGRKNPGEEPRGYLEFVAFDGVYRSRGLAAGTYRVVALSNEPAEATWADVTLAPGGTGALWLTMRPKPVVEGRWVSGEGEPVAGQLVVARTPGGHGFAAAHTDTNGAFRIEVSVGMRLTLHAGEEPDAVVLATADLAAEPYVDVGEVKDAAAR